VMIVTAHHARLGAWLLARLYQGGHFRPLYPMRLKAQLPHHRAYGSRTRRFG